MTSSRCCCDIASPFLHHFSTNVNKAEKDKIHHQGTNTHSLGKKKCGDDKPCIHEL